MKRILLTGFAALFLIAAQAQTSTKATHKAKKSHVSADSKAKAALAQKEKERQDAIEAQRQDLLRSDSVRKENDRVADSSFTTQQTMWKDSMNKVQDSTYNERYKSISTLQKESAKEDFDRNAILKSAKLSGEQSRQAKNINEAYSQKAKAITDDASLSAEQKQTQLAALNTERLGKLKAILGNSKAKRLEKARKDYVKKNGAAAGDSWMDTAEPVVDSKK
ncbi:MAG: hypothetical protein JSS85_11690 [Bacteroidetes bacterium]|nr:hypothetical protein [Bacteroidota bacterium]